MATSGTRARSAKAGGKPPAGKKIQSPLPSAGDLKLKSTEPEKRPGSVKSAKPPKPLKPVKPTRSPKAAKTAAPEPGSSDPARPKQKLVRDSFTMPNADFALIGMLKDRMVAFRRPAKKSELLRAGLHALMALPDAKLAGALNALAPLKPGRPRKPA